MPYKSKAQERWAHTPQGEEALGGPAKVKEWDRATKGRKLPERKEPMAKKEEKKEEGGTHTHYHSESHAHSHLHIGGKEKKEEGRHGEKHIEEVK
jgi:hypothetical protein